MVQYEYRVIPAPRRGEKARGVKTTPDRFALAMTNLMNQMAAEGWDYLRADTLPCDERVGLTGNKTTFQALLVFRRAHPAGQGDQDDPAVSGAEPLMLMAAPPAATAAPSLGAAVAPLGAAPPVGPAKDRDLAAE